MVSCLSSAWAIATLVPTPSVEWRAAGADAGEALASKSPANPPTPPSTAGVCVAAMLPLHQLDRAITGCGVDAGAA